MALTPYMNLSLPVPTVTLGPDWAEELNTAIVFIDAHDHTTGKGRLITSAAININDDLAINGHNLDDATSYRMRDLTSVLTGPDDLGCVFVVNGDLYYRNIAGQPVQITSGNALDATVLGGIGGDYTSDPDAEALYTSLSKTYTFNQASNHRAKIDVGDVLIRETTVGANAVTIKSPIALSSGYTITLLGALPASTLPVSISNSGQLTAAQVTTPQIQDDAVTTAKILNANVTNAKIADDTIQASKVDPASVFTKFVKEIFTANGTWTKPTGIIGDIVLLRGWGGGGGGGNYSTTGGGGGGGAAREILMPYDVSDSASYAVTIGAGGGGADLLTGNPGEDGYTTQFGTIQFLGGKGGGGTAATGAGGGGVNTTSVEQLIVSGNKGGSSGQSGEYSFNRKFSPGSPGGGSPSLAGGGGAAGPGGAGGNGAATAVLQGGSAAANSGAGGGGSTTNGSDNAKAGNGGSGYLEVCYWVNINP